MENYRATSQQWDELEKCSHAWPGAWGPCILELRARVEQLEAAQQDKLDRLIAQDRDDAPVAAGSLVERVAKKMKWCELPMVDACAAILEVAAWFGDRATPGTPQWIAAAELTDEVER